MKTPAWCTRQRAAFLARWNELMFAEQSSTTRFFFGWVTLGFGTFFAFSPLARSGTNEYALMMAYAPAWLWGATFLLNGAALIRGAWTNSVTAAMFWLEGVLGVVIWISSAYFISLEQQMVGAHFFGGGVAFWVYFRHPYVKKART